MCFYRSVGLLTIFVLRFFIIWSLILSIGSLLNVWYSFSESSCTSDWESESSDSRSIKFISVCSIYFLTFSLMKLCSSNILVILRSRRIFYRSNISYILSLPSEYNFYRVSFLLQHFLWMQRPRFDNHIKNLSKVLSLTTLCFSISLLTWDVDVNFSSKTIFLDFDFLNKSSSFVLALNKDFVNFKMKLYSEIGKKMNPNDKMITSSTPPRSPTRSKRLKTSRLCIIDSACRNTLVLYSSPGNLLGWYGLLNILPSWKKLPVSDGISLAILLSMNSNSWRRKFK